MKQYFKNYFRNFDYGLLFVYILLMLFGLVMIYSSSIWVSIMQYDANPNFYYNHLTRQYHFGADFVYGRCYHTL